jgi:hypothetical protein
MAAHVTMLRLVNHAGSSFRDLDHSSADAHSRTADAEDRLPSTVSAVVIRTLTAFCTFLNALTSI